MVIEQGWSDKKFAVVMTVGCLLVFGAAITAFKGGQASALEKEQSIPEARIIRSIEWDSWEATISKFEDDGNTCYVAMPPAKRDSKPSISCVRE